MTPARAPTSLPCGENRRVCECLYGRPCGGRPFLPTAYLTGRNPMIDRRARGVFKWAYPVGAGLVPARIARQRDDIRRCRAAGQPQGLAPQAYSDENRSRYRIAKKAATAMAAPLLIAVICALLLSTLAYSFSAPSATQTSPAMKEEEPVVMARRALSRLPIATDERLAAIKDARLRAAAQRAHQLLKALAENKDRQKMQGLLKQFGQAYQSVLTEGERAGYQA